MLVSWKSTLRQICVKSNSISSWLESHRSQPMKSIRANEHGNDASNKPHEAISKLTVLGTILPGNERLFFQCWVTVIEVDKCVSKDHVCAIIHGTEPFTILFKSKEPTLAGEKLKSTKEMPREIWTFLHDILWCRFFFAMLRLAENESIPFSSPISSLSTRNTIMMSLSDYENFCQPSHRPAPSMCFCSVSMMSTRILACYADGTVLVKRRANVSQMKIVYFNTTFYIMRQADVFVEAMAGMYRFIE